MADQQTEYVTLVSSDGFEFKVLRSAACLAGAIKRMLDPTSVSCPLLHPLTLELNSSLPGNFAEAISNRCVFENIKYNPLSLIGMRR